MSTSDPSVPPPIEMPSGAQPDVSPVPPVATVPYPGLKMPAPAAEIAKLLDEWLADESGYDERVWPLVKASLEENRTSHRKLFDG